MNAAAESEPGQPVSLWLRVSIGLVAAVPVILAVILAGNWGVDAARQVNRETDAVARICDLGGTFTMESAANPASIVHRVPEFMGRDLFNHVYKIDLSADAQDSFPHRKTGQLTDQGLVHVTALTRLQELDLEDRSITDAALVYLRSLHSLRSLNLRGTKVTPQAMKDLQGALPQCEISY